MLRALISIIVVITGIAWSFPSGAEPRGGEEVFFKNGAGDEFYYEPDTIKAKEGQYGATVEIRGVSASPEAPVREFNRTIEIKCTGRLYRIVESQVTRNDGTTFTEHPSLEWTAAVAETSAYRPLVNEVCKRVKQLKR